MDVANLFSVKVRPHPPKPTYIPPSFAANTPPQDKVVLITGGAKGLGLMISTGFVLAGAKVYISSRDASACDSACAATPAAAGSIQAWYTGFCGGNNGVVQTTTTGPSSTSTSSTNGSGSKSNGGGTWYVSFSSPLSSSWQYSV